MSGGSASIASCTQSSKRSGSSGTGSLTYGAAAFSTSSVSPSTRLTTTSSPARAPAGGAGLPDRAVDLHLAFRGERGDRLAGRSDQGLHADLRPPPAAVADAEEPERELEERRDPDQDQVPRQRQEEQSEDDGDDDDHGIETPPDERFSRSASESVAPPGPGSEAAIPRNWARRIVTGSVQLCLSYGEHDSGMTNVTGLIENVALGESSAGESLAASYELGFSGSDLLTLGLEEELILVDPVSFEPADEIELVLSTVSGARFEAEFRASQVELVMPVSLSAGDLGRELSLARATLVEALDGRVRLLAAGTHPVSTRAGPRHRPAAVPPDRLRVPVGDEARRAERPARSRRDRRCRRGARDLQRGPRLPARAGRPRRQLAVLRGRRCGPRLDPAEARRGSAACGDSPGIRLVA